MTKTLEKTLKYHQRAEEISRLIRDRKQEDAIREYRKFSATETVNFASDYPEDTARIIWTLLVYYEKFPKGTKNG